jgi:hypothetical protein
MILRLICPTGHVLDVDSQLAGKKIRCGACGRIMLVPHPPGQPRPTAAKPGRKPASPTVSKELSAELPKPEIAERPAPVIAEPTAKPAVFDAPAKPVSVELPGAAQTLASPAVFQPPAEPIVPPSVELPLSAELPVAPPPAIVLEPPIEPSLQPFIGAVPEPLFSDRGELIEHRHLPSAEAPTALQPPQSPVTMAPPQPAVAPAPDYSIAGQLSADEYLSRLIADLPADIYSYAPPAFEPPPMPAAPEPAPPEPAAQMPFPVGPLPTMTPEPAMSPPWWSSASNKEPATEFLSPLALELPPAPPEEAAPEETVPEPPRDVLPPEMPFEQEPLVEEKFAETVTKSPAAAEPMDLPPMPAAESFTPEPAATVFSDPLTIESPPSAPETCTPEPFKPPLIPSFEHETLKEEQFAQPTCNPEPAAMVESASVFAAGPTFELPPVDEPEAASAPEMAPLPPADFFESYPLADREVSSAIAEPPTLEPPPSPAATSSREPAMMLLPPPEPVVSPDFEYNTEADEVKEDEDDEHERHDDGIVTEPQATAIENYDDGAVALRRSRGVEFLSWLHNHLPARPDHVPADAIEPTWGEKRTARGLAMALAGLALFSVAPVVIKHHIDLRSAPLWALLIVLMASVQLVFAGWLANAPDWATVRVQMVISAALTTLYAMAMTLMLLTPLKENLILGLYELWPLGAAWCGVMFFLMGVATWYCGRTATRWREQIEMERLNAY